LSTYPRTTPGAPAAVRVGGALGGQSRQTRPPGLALGRCRCLYSSPGAPPSMISTPLSEHAPAQLATEVHGSPIWPPWSHSPSQFWSLVQNRPVRVPPVAPLDEAGEANGGNGFAGAILRKRSRELGLRLADRGGRLCIGAGRNLALRLAVLALAERLLHGKLVFGGVLGDRRDALGRVRGCSRSAERQHQTRWPHRRRSAAFDCEKRFWYMDFLLPYLRAPPTLNGVGTSHGWGPRRASMATTCDARWGCFFRHSLLTS